MKWRIGIYSLLAMWLIANGVASAAAYGVPLVEAYTSDDYGYHPQNWSVLQGTSDFLYFGGRNGVLEFDGDRWHLIETPYRTAVRALLAAPNGTIYAATSGDIATLTTNDRGPAKWQSLRHLIPAPYREFDAVWQLRWYQDALWAVTSRYVFRLQDERVTTWTSEHQFGGLVELDGHLAVQVFQHGIYRLGDALAEAPSLTLIAGTESLADSFVYWGIALGDESTLLGSGARLFRFERGRADPLPHPLATQGRASNQLGLLYAAQTLADGRIAISVLNQGLAIIDQAGALDQLLTRDDGLVSNTILGMGADEDGGLWLAQDGGFTRLELAMPVTRFSYPRGIENANSLLRHQGHLLATSTRGLFQLTEQGPQRGHFRRLGSSAQHFTALSDHRGLLVGGMRLYRHSGPWNGQAAEAMQAVEGVERVRFLLKSNQDEKVVYAGGRNGVYQLHWEPRSIRLTRHLDLSGLGIRGGTQDPQGQLWLGTNRGEVIAVTDFQQTARYGSDHGLPPSEISPIWLRGELIFLSDQGAYRFDANQQRFVAHWPYPLPPIENSRQIHRLFEVSANEFWAVIGEFTWRYRLTPTDSGAQWSLDKYYFDAMPQAISYGMWVEPDSLWLARSHDVLHIARHRQWGGRATKRPSIRAIQYLVPPDNGQIDNQTIALPVTTRQLDQVMPNGAQAISVRFSSTAFPRNDRLTFRSRLWSKAGNLNPPWGEWRPQTTRELGRLPGGKYHFQVQARNVFGALSDISELEFSIAPAWHQGVLARLALLLAVALLISVAVVLAARWHSARLRTRNLRLKQLVDEQTVDIQQQSERIRHLDQAKTHFFTNVAHEFKTPLSLIMAPLDEALSKLPKPTDAHLRPLLELAQDNAGRVLELVDQLLEVNRLETGQAALSVTYTDLAAFCRDQAEQGAKLAASSQLKLQLNLPDQPVPAWFDRGKMAMVLLNLMANACKYTQAGGQILLALEPGDNCVRIRLCDDGPGISAQDLPHVFDRFYRGHAHKNTAGSGIGLALCREIVHAHGGQITVQSPVPNRSDKDRPGSQFVVQLRPGRDHFKAEHIAAEDKLDPDTRTLATARKTESPDLPPETLERLESDSPCIMVVDDNAEIRALIARHLQKRFRVIEASDGVDALHLASVKFPDLIVSDIMMPRMDGLSLVKALQQDDMTACIPLILLTARSDRQTLFEGLGAGAVEYLEKPFDPLELAARIEAILKAQRRLIDHLKQQHTLGWLDRSAIRATPSDDDFIDQLEKTIAEHLADPAFNVNQLAAILFLSRSVLTRKVKALLGSTPLALIRQARMQRAAQLLRQPGVSVTQAAYSVGFKSLSYFAQAFELAYACRPSEYRRNSV